MLRRNILLLLTIISIIAFFGTSCGRRSRPTSESRIIVIPEGRISGAFIQFPLPYATSDWEQELSFMQAIGFDTMVIQWSMRDTFAYYPSALARASDTFDSVRIILTGAEKRRMRVFLGLAMTSIWWKGEFNEEFLQGELRRNKKVVKELWERYSSFSSFAGWYIPYEIGDIYSRNDETRVLLTEFIAELTAFCHQTSGGKPVAISAYFSGELDPAEYGDLWKKIFASADIDIMVLQDGAGSHLLSLELAMRRFAALKRVCESEGIKLWSYLEIFDQIHGWPIDSKPREVVTADLGKVLEQIDAEEEYVDKILCFEFSRYMSPQQNEASKRLYEDYMRFYKGELKR